MNETRFPLCWPANWKRSTSRTRAQFGRFVPQFRDGTPSYSQKGQLTVPQGFDRLQIELERLGVRAENIIVSTNVVLNLSGAPHGGRGEPRDPGVAVYWKRKGKGQCMAIDRYDRVADNLAAVAATLGAMRAIERHGGGEILDRTFVGFAQLASGERPWRDVFGLPPGSILSAGAVDAQFRQLARALHPDKSSGDHDRMVELNLARAAALAEVSQWSK